MTIYYLKFQDYGQRQRVILRNSKSVEMCFISQLVFSTSAKLNI